MYSRLYKHVLSPLYESVIKRRNMLKYRAFLEESQWWPYEKLQAFQWEELMKLLKHAYENAPYWCSQFDKLEQKPPDIKTMEDFRRLPIIDKNTIRTHYNDLIASNYRGKTWRKSTGGSTGQPLHFECMADTYDWRVADSRRGYSWAGCEDGKKSAYIWGVAIGKTPVLTRLKVSLHHAFLRQRYYNSFVFTEEKMSAALRDMNRFKPEYIVGYTNPLYEFTKYVARSQMLKFKPQAIISAAEKLHEFQRDKIRAVFGCPVFNTYGSREFMLIASECEVHKGLHVNIENLVVEIIKDNGEPAKPGEMGDIVITDLHNYGMPFIRYKIGDMAVASNRLCSCGRGLPMIEDIVGRSLDMIRTPDGKHIPGEFFPHLMKEFRWVKQFQVIQEDMDSLIIKIMREGEMRDREFNIMKDEIAKVIGQKTVVDFQFVKDIPLTQTGKHRVTISNVN